MDASVPCKAFCKSNSESLEKIRLKESSSGSSLHEGGPVRVGFSGLPNHIWVPVSRSDNTHGFKTNKRK